ncbi:FAD/NAD(P)-binding oxidoreductase [Nocardiopsis ansamitocini]|uniref:FAD/NAD(P)-binding oxidoreductase n=1 Tax=Nocardiopsis ansamitocini TaxID=1670832 RepID=A0A9W6PB75_9ACTN|nr:FAD/NAD(P)-binding oxidoreductase [Nocardiopsis ansamitocini]
MVGAAIARELAVRGADVVLVDAEDDVGNATSKANTAILHTGFDAKPGTLESRLVARGHTLLSAYARRAGIPLEPLGALLVAWDDEQLAALPGLREKAEHNGYRSARVIGASEVRAREPHVGAHALGALEVPDEGIVCPWTPTLAFVTEAKRHGATVLLSTRVRGAEPRADHVELATTAGGVRAREVVNAAGLGSDTVHRMFGHATFTVTPRRGQLIVFDKLARRLINHVILPVPTAMGKGVLVAPTVYGNVMLGPTAENLDDKRATESTEEGLAQLRAKGAHIIPELLGEEVTTIYAGLRAATEHDDYQVSFHPDQHYTCVGGIRSTGLTSGMAIAEHVAAQLGQRHGLDLGEAPAPDGLPEPPRMPPIGQAQSRPYQQPERIAADPSYGQVVCFCERVSRGEIRDALCSDLPPATADGLRRRTRAGMGRCQGFFCGAAVRRLLDDGPDAPLTAEVDQ